MNKPYAVFTFKGKQFLASQGDVITSDLVDSEPGEKISVADVLLVVDSKGATVGRPVVAKKTVQLEVKSHKRAAKIRVAKFKAKSRYRLTRGHRQHQSQLEVVAIK